MSHKKGDAAHHHHEHHAQSRSWQPHKDWRIWVGVGLMLAAMLAYVLSFDESLPPGGQVAPSVPAAP